MEVDAAKNLALSLMREHGLTDWVFGFDRSLRRFGICNQTRHKISLSRILVGLNNEEQVRNTILHEIAHALAGYEEGHGPRWKAQALAIGCDAKRCYSNSVVSVPVKQWAGKCEKCAVIVCYSFRRRNLVHRRCFGKILWYRREQIIENKGEN